MAPELILDNSAWSRLDTASLDQSRAEEIADMLEDGRLATCLPFLLEAGYSARSGRDHAEILDELAALAHVQIEPEVERRAVQAQQQLARLGHHRLPPVDLIIAALADVNRLGVLHYDRDYDLLLETTDLRFESVWLSERGSL